MNLKCIKEFYDKKDKVKRNVGDVFTADEARLKEIQEYESASKQNYVEVVPDAPEDEVPEEQPEEEAQPKKSKKSAAKE